MITDTGMARNRERALARCNFEMAMRKKEIQDGCSAVVASCPVLSKLVMI